MTAAKVRMVRPPRNSSVVIPCPFRSAFQGLNWDWRKGFPEISRLIGPVTKAPLSRQRLAQRRLVIVNHLTVGRHREVDAHFIDAVLGFDFHMAIKLTGKCKDQT